jgi:serine/threonine protein kinase
VQTLGVGTPDYMPPEMLHQARRPQPGSIEVRAGIPAGGGVMGLANSVQLRCWHCCALWGAIDDGIDVVGSCSMPDGQAWQCLTWLGGADGILLPAELRAVHPLLPAQAQQPPYDARKVDAWALGVLMYLLLTGRYPFEVGGSCQAAAAAATARQLLPLRPPAWQLHR